MAHVLLDLIARSAPTIIGGLVSLVLAALLGHRITNYWTYRQKKRELLLTATADFYSSYGEFYAVWKLWNHSRATGTDGADDNRRWELLERICRAEATLEGMLIRLTSERQLSDDDIQILGAWRTVYKTLRRAIEQNQALPWYSSDNPQYFQFKNLAPRVAALILGERTPGSLEAGSLESAVNKVTSGAWRMNGSSNYEEPMSNKADAGHG